MTQQRIHEWVDHYGLDGVYISFSGGKDSTVLLTIAREMYPDIKAVFSDTGLEFPEIREFVRTFDNVDWVKPKMTFRQVIEKYGYPMISKEVSECVWGARRYLSAIEKEHNLDQHTGKALADSEASRTNVVGGGTKTSTEGSEVLVSTKPIPYSYQLEKLLGTFGMPCKQQKGMKGGVESQDSQTSQASERISRDISMLGYGKTTDSFRVQRLMNTLPRDGGKATEENIPSTRSMFSCERYQFFLDAPFEIGQQCCRVMKKSPLHRYEKKTGRVSITAMMASESKRRTQKWLTQGGCNAFDAKKPMSMPMSFWLEQDVLAYVYEHHIPLAKVYGDVVIDYQGMGQLEGQMSFSDLGVFDTGRPLLKVTGYERTGCMFCGFGCHLEKESRFEKMKRTHPKQYEYIMKPWEEGGLGYKDVIDWINEHGNMHIRY